MNSPIFACIWPITGTRQPLVLEMVVISHLGVFSLDHMAHSQKKESTGRLLCAAFFVSVVAIFLDIVGGGLELWAYSVRAHSDYRLFYTLGCLHTACCDHAFSAVLSKSESIYQGRYLPLFPALSFASQLLLGLDLPPNLTGVIYSFPILYGIYLLSHVIVTRKSFEALYTANR
jgi:hypothetical protein